MAVYEQYPEIMASHPPYVQRMEALRQRRMMADIKCMLSCDTDVHVLEIGVGVGLFAHACQEENWIYQGVDRSQKMCDILSRDFTMRCAEAPPLPDDLDPACYDIIYSSFVLEHMKDGVQAYEFMATIRDHLKPGGLAVIVVPDCMSLGMEFWNIDYTHTFPTTERNVRQVISDSGLQTEKVVSFRGPYIKGWCRQMLRVAAWPYNYRLMGALLGHKALFYSVYQYIKQDVLMFIIRNV